MARVATLRSQRLASLRDSRASGRVPFGQVCGQTPDRAGMTEAQVAENPLLEGLGPRRTPEPCVLIIFGASGDLTHRKIFPALYSLAYRRLLPEQFAVVGVARTAWTDDEFRARIANAIAEFGRDDVNTAVW